MKKKSESAFFRKALLEWNNNLNHRELPWKSEQNPYFIWLSEVILQQTRAEQGLPYYLKFKKHYPTVQILANSKIDNILRDWQGLGYYSRARNLHETGKIIAKEFNGEFPNTYDDLIKLKGIGDYTASAIASFAFGRQNAVLDGNVIRVLARYFGIEAPFDTSNGRKEFKNLATETMANSPSAAYNQAIMDFGATVCTPKKPLCADCPLSRNCFAYQKELIAFLPSKQKKLMIKDRFFYYLILKSENHIWIKKREGKDIWNSLWEFPLIEKDKSIDLESFKKVEKIFSLPKNSVISISEKQSQRLTHQKIQSVFIEIDANLEMPFIMGCQKVRINELKNYAFPKSIVSYIRKIS
jgi:A/G-specific adenine glycosylase